MHRPSIIAFITILILTIGCSGDSSNVAEGSNPGTPGWGAGTPGADTWSDQADAQGAADGVSPALPGQVSESCTMDSDCPPATPYCGASQLCFQCLEDSQCPTGAACNNGTCLTAACTPGEKVCTGATLQTCNAFGSGWAALECPGENAQCVNGACVGCDAGTSVCVGKAERLVCDPTTSTMVNETCLGDAQCVQGECLACYPSTKQCDGDMLQTCTMSGAWENTQDCKASGGVCQGGTCISGCGASGKLTNEGCDYWAVDMDNGNVGDPSSSSPFAVIVSNLNDTSTSVTITGQSSAGATPTTLAAGEVAPNALSIFEINPQNMGGSGLFWKAVRVESSGPIVAYQFNPLSNVEVYSNDASLLLPSNTFGTEYVVVSRAQIPIEVGAFNSTIAIVAREAGTQVTITPSAPTAAGVGILALAAGQTATVTLEPYQVLNIQSNMDGADLTGTIITSDKPIGVFGGHEAAVSGTQCCADHIEQQLFPVATWGKTYIATKSFPRGLEKDYWRIVAAYDGTQVTVAPMVQGVPGTITLNRGQFYELQTEKDIVLTSNNPVMVAQLLPSSFEIVGPPSCVSSSECLTGYSCDTFFGAGECSQISGSCFSNSDCPSGHICVDAGGLFGPSCEPMGDPALILSAPVEQFRDRYVFLSPTNYLDDYVNIVAPNSATVTLDGSVVSSALFTSVPGSTYKVARVKVADGTHVLEASEPVGVVVYGYDDDVSYGYTAGLSLSDL